jgi:hypothetical protein
MFFGMVQHRVGDKEYPRRIGQMSPSFEKIKALVVKRKGYIVNESGDMVGQAFDPELPRYVGPVDNGTINNVLKNIGSGEDAYA